MRIPLEFNGEHLTALATFKWKHCLGKLRFYIDTGSGTSLIGPQDSLLLKIPASSRPFEKHARIGGSSLALHVMDGLVLSFKTEENLIERIETGFLVSHSTRDTDKKTETCPSILGTDFLKNNGLALYFAPSMDIAYLERIG